MKKNFVLITVLGFLFACSKNADSAGSSVDCSGTAKSFATDVSPVIQAKCAVSGCHPSGSNNGPGELISYSEIYNARIAIRNAVITGEMPQNGSLTTAQKNAIICWIDNGASNN